MDTLRSTKVKICCISSLDEAREAIHAGADALGLVSAMPSGPGVISEELIRTIAAEVPPPVATFLLTCHQRVEDIVAQQRRCGTNTVQICDRLLDGTHQDLRAAMPGVAVVQVVHVSDQESIAEAAGIAPHVHALLLDSGNQALAVKELGGTGRAHDWRLSAQIVAQAGVPVFLAGGLRADNIAEALALVEPWGVDLCSGVRTGGRLDAAKLSVFLRACRAAGIPGRLRPA